MKKKTIVFVRNHIPYYIIQRDNTLLSNLKKINIYFGRNFSSDQPESVKILGGKSCPLMAKTPLYRYISVQRL